MTNQYYNEDEIIPITESTFNQFNNIRKQIFTKKTLENLDNIVEKVPFENIDKIYKKLDVLIKEELKRKNTDSISAILGLYACFISYYDLLLNAINDLEKDNKN